MIAAIMQPTYLPWIGYFDMIDAADRFVFLDDAQVLKRSWGVRNRILTRDGEVFLTVPLSGHSHGHGSPFTETLVDRQDAWARKHLSTIRHAYGKAPYFADVFANLEAVLLAGHGTIGALNQAFITSTARLIGIETAFSQSSALSGIEGRKDQRLVSICQAIGADTYLCAPGSAVYIEQDREGGAFAGTGLTLRYHAYDHPVYAQGGAAFTSHMSVVDLLMNTGYASALSVIRSGRRAMLTSAEMKERLP